jgi:protein-disulfide isomerase
LSLNRRELLTAGAALALAAAAVTTGSLPPFATLAFAADTNPSPEDLAHAGPDGDVMIGSDKAPVTVIEYASMTCPHCAHFEETTLPELKKRYIDTGKVRYVMREFPLDALAAAGFMLARCAGDDKYHAMIDVLFAQQQNWAFVDAQQVLPAMSQIAKQAGFTQEQFEKCLQDKTLYDGVMAVKQRASDKFKIDGTPTFFINGKRYGGELSVAEFDKAVEPLLKS